jgi:hypothetical protein
MITQPGLRRRCALLRWPRGSSRGVRSLAFTTGSAIGVAVLTVSAAPTQSRDANADIVLVQPADPGTALDNPGMGWVFHYYDNSIERYGSRLAASDTVDDFPGLTVVYLRLAWAYLEPEEGRFNWSVVDTPAQRWIAKGKKVALRFTTSETGQVYATPEWVRKAGAQGTFTKNRQVVTEGGVWEPHFDDPVFLEKLESFMAAAGRRYDGNPNIAFVDVGTMGVWGEGHSFATTLKPYPRTTVFTHIDLHLKYFKKTLLAMNDDFAGPEAGEQPEPDATGLRAPGDPARVTYAFEKGLTLRDDSILVQAGPRAYFHANMARVVWQDRPVILESEHYGPSVKRGAWQDGSRYLDAIEDYRASYASIHWWPREFLQDNRALIDRINRRLGYRIQLVEASWPKSVAANSAFAFTARWRNAGVAPCLPGGHPAITLKDRDGGITAVFVDESVDVRTLSVGPPDQGPILAQTVGFTIPSWIQPGTYDVHVSVGARDGTPAIALPLPDGDGQRRYRLGTVRLN